MRKKCKSEYINEKFTFNTCFRWVSFRRMNVLQTRWMMPAVCCLKRKYLFSQKWELCMKHHFSLYCYYFYFRSLPFFVACLSFAIYICATCAVSHILTVLCVYVSWKCMFGNWYLLLDYSYYIPVKRRPTKVQILEENG